MNKKGAIAESLTWMVAFPLIVIILVIFVVLSSGFSVTKKIMSNENEITINELQTKFFNQRQISFILNYPLEEGDVRDLIVGYYNGDVEEKKLKKVIEEIILEECERDYYFIMDSDLSKKSNDIELLRDTNNYMFIGHKGVIMREIEWIPFLIGGQEVNFKLRIEEC